MVIRIINPREMVTNNRYVVSKTLLFVLSTGGSLPEIGGDAAVYFDPYDEVSMRNCIEDVLSDETKRDRLKEKGYKRVKEFSWIKTAQQTADVYRKVVGEK